MSKNFIPFICVKVIFNVFSGYFLYGKNISLFIHKSYSFDKLDVYMATLRMNKWINLVYMHHLDNMTLKQILFIEKLCQVKG